MLLSTTSREQAQSLLSQIGDSLLNDCVVDETIWEEEPVDIRTFIESPLYLDAKKYTYPIVIHDLENIFKDGYTEAVLMEGIGSGKSHTSSIAITYMIYRTLCLRNPQRYYKLSPESKIAFMNMSTSATQARKVVFERISSMVQNCKWFARRGYLPNPNKTSELEFPKSIYVLPGSSSETAPLGFDILGAVMDEAAFMTDTKVSGKASAENGIHDVAEEVFNAMKRRIESRFLNHGLIIIISSPRYKGDFISRKYEEAKENKEIYARRRATFDCKPKDFYGGRRFVIDLRNKTILKNEKDDLIIVDDSNKFYKQDENLITIPIEHLMSFKRNFVKQLRDLCAIASRAVDPYIINYGYWKEIADTSSLRHPFHDGRFEDWFRGQGQISAVHVDLGTGKVGRCACGIALACIDPLNSEKISVPFMEAIRAPEGGEVDFSKVREVIVTLRDLGFDIRYVTFDGWNSIDSRQILEKLGFNVEYLSLDRTLEPYETFKESVNLGKVDFYNHEVFLDEVEGLELIEGKKVEHAPDGTKDVTDAVAGAVFTLKTHPVETFDMWTG